MTVVRGEDFRRARVDTGIGVRRSGGEQATEGGNWLRMITHDDRLRAARARCGYCNGAVSPQQQY
jgi:hypothetical protein